MCIGTIPQTKSSIFFSRESEKEKLCVVVDYTVFLLAARGAESVYLIFCDGGGDLLVQGNFAFPYSMLGDFLFGKSSSLLFFW